MVVCFFNRIHKSSAVINSANGHIDIIYGLDMEAEISAHQIFLIYMKAPCMSNTLSYAHNHMPIIAWEGCCQESIMILSELRHAYFKSHEIIHHWHYLLNSRSDEFPNPSKASK